MRDHVIGTYVSGGGSVGPDLYAFASFRGRFPGPLRPKAIVFGDHYATGKDTRPVRHDPGRYLEGYRNNPPPHTRFP